MPHGQKVWHAQVISEETNRTLDDLNRTSLLERFYLAGGTGLALHLGHRRSKDLDFFTEGPLDADLAIDRLRGLKGLRVIEKSEGTLHANLGDTRVSFLRYPYPLLFAHELFHEVKVADPRDIGCMKLSAIASRGTQRDFIDLYTVAQLYGLPPLVSWFEEKFREVNYSRVHLLKSLTYFEDAEREPMPDMLAPLSWEEVKLFFCAEVPKLL